MDVVATNSFEEFKNRSLELAKKVDAFFVINHDTIKDRDDKYVDMLKVGKWYLENIKKPEASHEDQFVREGMLLTANDSGYNQSFQAFEMGYDILEQGLSPARMRTKTPARGPFMVNKKRADILYYRFGKSAPAEQLALSAAALESNLSMESEKTGFHLSALLVFIGLNIARRVLIMLALLQQRLIENVPSESYPSRSARFATTSRSSMARFSKARYVRWLSHPP